MKTLLGKEQIQALNRVLPPGWIDNLEEILVNETHVILYDPNATIADIGYEPDEPSDVLSDYDSEDDRDDAFEEYQSELQDHLEEVNAVYADYVNDLVSLHNVDCKLMGDSHIAIRYA